MIDAALFDPPLPRENFARASEPHRRALKLHCYRMLGAPHEAEDAVQETYLRAWASLDGYSGGSLRGWLTRIATRVCLDALAQRARSRRWLPDQLDPERSGDPGPSADTPWLEPYPDAEIADEAPGPEARYVAREAVRLAFVAAIQELPPRQRAALLLCDVLGWSGAEAAETLEFSTAGLNSALQRARETLKLRPAKNLAAAPDQQALLDRYLEAWEAHDIDGLVAVLRRDARCVMPPWRLWLPDRDAIAGFFAQAWTGCLGLRLIPAAANGQPAFAAYQRQPDGRFAANALHVLGLAEDGVAEMALFLDEGGGLFERFGLASTLA